MKTCKIYNQINGLLRKLVNALFVTRKLNCPEIEYAIEWLGWKRHQYMHPPLAGIRYPFTGGGF